MQSKSSTKLNVNIRTLLANCDELVKDESNYWRLKKFIKSLDTMIDELNCMDDAHGIDKIPEYKERLQRLKSLTNYIDSPPQASRTKRLREAAETSDSILKEMNQLNQSKQYVELRRELLQEDTLRRRRPMEDSSGDQSEAVKYIRDNQEKITEHMLSLTRNLREQTETANKIIKKDTEMMSRSSGMTDRNISALNKETEKLEDHSRNAWKCWMWLMIIFVIVTFIAMVLFMKIVKKKKY
ncbi:vesicle transport protein Use1 [Haematobia irritans]|uniref:vesicle transport protein Use1 n=1 Tax=Haematobia irritans TaxID=7368 RepID=UPI003F4FDE2C